MEPREFVEHELQVINTLFSMQKEVYPTVILVKNDKRYQIPVHYSNAAHKDIVSQGIKDLVKKAEPDIVVYVSEAWMKVIRNKQDRLPWNLANDPDRIEIVIVQIEFKTGEKFGCQAKIIRDDGPPHLNKFEINKDDFSMGRFVDFFPVKRLN
jgi:hypothetical protein